MPTPFPVSPANGDTYDFGGNRYVYSSTLGAWSLVTNAYSARGEMQVFSSSGTWTKPANAQVVEIILIGGGYGGQNAGTGSAKGTGGYGGTFARWIGPASDLTSASYAVTVGAGGAASSGNAAGGASTFDFRGLSSANTSLFSSVAGEGGDGGTTTSPTASAGKSSVHPYAGYGGAGGAGNASGTGSAGSAGKIFGGGGGGGGAGGGGGFGGAGGAGGAGGVIVITYY